MTGSASVPTSRGRAGLRRVVDMVAGLLLLVVAAPVLLVVAAAIRVRDGAPILFRQERIGQYQRPFVMYKFRTMRNGSSAQPHRDYVTGLLTGAVTDGGQAGVYKLTDDPRITRTGRLLRRTSLDELPQLFNVVAGHMSLVGPRPALSYEVEVYQPHHLRRFEVKPGITGLWQVTGRSTVPLARALDLDVEYVRTRGPLLDAWILLRTAMVVARGFGAR